MKHVPELLKYRGSPRESCCLEGRTPSHWISHWMALRPWCCWAGRQHGEAGGDGCRQRQRGFIRGMEPSEAAEVVMKDSKAQLSVLVSVLESESRSRSRLRLALLTTSTSRRGNAALRRGLLLGVGFAGGKFSRRNVNRQTHARGFVRYHNECSDLRTRFRCQQCNSETESNKLPRRRQAQVMRKLAIKIARLSRGT